MNSDERNRPWLYAQDYRTDADLRKLGIRQPAAIWPVLVGLVIAAAMCWFTRGL